MATPLPLACPDWRFLLGSNPVPYTFEGTRPGSREAEPDLVVQGYQSVELLSLSPFILDLASRINERPDVRLMINAVALSRRFMEHIPLGDAWTCMDITVTNLKSSSFSIGSIRLNGEECLPAPEVSFHDEKLDVTVGTHKEFWLYEDGLARIPALPLTPYLLPRESIRGLVFWTFRINESESLELSTMILSSNREIKAVADMSRLMSNAKTTNRSS